jgi:hypothetical protein
VRFLIFSALQSPIQTGDHPKIFPQSYLIAGFGTSVQRRSYRRRPAEGATEQPARNSPNLNVWNKTSDGPVSYGEKKQMNIRKAFTMRARL